MFCRNCGTDLSEDSVFCFKCGTKMDKSTNPQISQKPVARVYANNETKSPSIFLVLGIFFMPYLFAWMTLNKGYSKNTRIISLGWMALICGMFAINLSKASDRVNEVRTENESGTKTDVFSGMEAKTTSEVCSYMGNSPLKPDGWKNLDITFGCIGGPIAIGNGMPPNTIAYHATGTETKVKKLQYFVYVNDKRDKANAMHILEGMAEELALQATGSGLPDHIKESIQNSKSATEAKGHYNFTVKRENFAKGYQMEFTIE